MATTEATRTRTRVVAPWVGLGAAVVLVVLAFVVPPLAGWEVHARSGRASGGHELPPLHGFWDPRWTGPGTLPTLLLALLAVRYAVDLAERLPWRRLLLASYAAGLAWLLGLALVDGEAGLTRVPAHGYEYLITARTVDDVPAMLAGFVDRIPLDSADHWVPHVAGHPPGALLFFVALVRLGLGGDLAVGLVVAALAATTAPAVLSTVRTLGAEAAARRAAPFLVLGPAAVFMAVSGDAVFGAFAAWGLAALAVAATSTGRRALLWSVLAGLLLGWCVMSSYGLPLLGFLALAVLHLARSWRPLPIAAAAAAAVVLTFAALGFAWWEAYPVLTDRYWDGIAADRPAAYWLWGNLAALLVSAGLMLGPGLASAWTVRRRAADRVVVLLVAAAALSIVLADLSRMSKAEVERIWLPFVPWLLLSTALLPERWRRWGLALQLGSALLLEVLLFTSW